jgi:hypothetical protein
VKRRVTRYRFIVRTTGGLESSYGVTGSERWPFKHAERRRAPLSSFPSARQAIGEIVAVWISALFAAVTLAFAFAVFRRRDVAGD